VFGRAATDAEVKAGLTFIATEPLKDYEERKAEQAKKEKENDAKDGKDGKSPKASDAAKADGPEKVGEGMMAGVIPGAGKKADQEKLLPVTPWGRYVKVLLSSSEFVFVN